MVNEAGAVVLTPKPVRERGYANSNAGANWWSDLTAETTPELIWPNSVLVYSKMRRQDTQVASVLRAVTSPILRTQWRIDGTGCDPEVTRFVARDLGLPIVGEDDSDHAERLRGRDRFSWDAHLRLALLCLPFGHMFFEQVYRDPALDPNSDGKYHLRKLGPRFPWSIAEIKTARDGGLVSIRQNSAGNVRKDETPLPVSRLVAYVLGREGDWYGQSILRSAYKNWLLKDRALRTWDTSIDRNGVGVPFYTAPDGATSLDAGQRMAEDLRAGENAGGALPYGAKMELLGVNGTLPDIEKFVAYQDQAIARAALGHFLNLGSQTGGQVGSYNLGSVLADTFHLSLDEVANLVKVTGTSHIVEDIVDLNFGASVPAPRLTYDPIGTRQSELDRVREAAGVTSDAELVKLLRSLPITQEA